MIRIFAKPRTPPRDSVSAIRVVHVDHSSEPGGAELALVRLVQNNKLWDASVVTPHAGGRSVFDGLENYEQVGAPQHAGARSSSKWKAGHFALMIGAAAFHLRRSRAFRLADVVHANSARASIYATLACCFTKKRLVIHIRDMVTPQDMGGLGAMVMHRFVLPRAHGVLASSSACLDTARDSMRPHAVSAIVPSPSNVVKGITSNVRSDVRQVGMVARIAEWKGQLLLLEAFAKAFPDANVRLRFAGKALFDDLAYEAELRRTVEELNLSDRVTFEGHLEDITEFLREIDVAVHSSIRPEPLGQNVLQYLAAGKPTVVSGEGGPAEWVTDGLNGLTFRPRDKNDLASKLRLLQADLGLRRRLSHKALLTPGLLTNEEIQEVHAQFFGKLVAECPSVTKAAKRRTAS